MSTQDASDGVGRPADPSRLAAVWRHVVELVRGECERSQTRRAALLAFLIRVVSAAIAYVFQVALARWMGSFEYGIFVFVWVWVLILGGLAPLGLSVAATRFVPEYLETGRLSLLRGLLLASRAIAVSVSTIIAGAGLAGLALFGHLIETHYLLPAYLILFCLPLYTLVDIQDGIARGKSWIDVALVPPYILRPLLILLAMAAAYGLGLPMTATTAAGSAIVGCWLAGLAQTFALEHRLRGTVAPGPRSYRIGFWLATALPILLTRSFELLLQNTDVLVLSLYMSPSDVAVYFAALKTMGLIAFVHFAVSTAAANRFSAYNARGDRDALVAFIRESVQWTFWPSLAAAIGLLALGRPLLSLFGPEFTSGYAAMFVLALGFLVRATVGPAEYVLNMLGEQKLCAGVLFFSAVLNLALNIVLIPYLGLLGAATATAASVATASLLMLLVARRRLGLDLLIWRRAVDGT